MQRFRTLLSRIFPTTISERGDDEEASSIPSLSSNVPTSRAFKQRSRALCGVGLLLLTASNANAQTTQPTDPSVIAFDNLFKTLDPDQKTVLIDDMVFKVETLKAWRNELAGGRTTRGAIDGTTQIWHGRRIPYIFDGNMSESYRTMVRNAMFEVQKCANVIWVPQVAGDTDYVRFFDNGSGGMNSFVGRNGGEQRINIDRSLNLIRCAHELAHCMGFIHEQCRSDRDTYVTVTSTSGSNNALTIVNWAKLPTSASLNQGPYDFDSMMHYPASSSAVTGGVTYSATITPKEPYYTNAGKPRLGQETHISLLDSAAMAKRYGAPCAISGRVTTSSGNPLSGLTLTITPTGNSAYYGPPVTTDSNGNYTLPGTATGTYSLTLSGGPVIPVSTPVTIGTTSATGINFTVSDNVAPSITISSPTNGSTAAYVGSVSGNATDNLGVDYVGVVLKNNADGKWWVWDSAGTSGSWGGTTFDTALHFKKVDNPTNSASFDWTTTLPALPPGYYNIQAKSVDVDGTDTEYVPSNYTIVSAKPLVSISSPAHGSFVKTFTSISGTATDPDGIAGNSVNVSILQGGQYWNGTAWQNTLATLSVPLSGNTWSTTLVPTGNNLRAGIYLIEAKTTDTLGNESTIELGTNQIAFRLDSVAPTCTISTPSNGSTVNGVYSISGTANDDFAVESVSLDIIRLSDNKWWDNDHWGDGSATMPLSYNSTSKAWQSTGPLPQGTSSTSGWVSGDYRILFIVTDKAGNSTHADSYITFTNTFLWTGDTLRDNDSTNNSNNWDTAANWSPVGVPGAKDVAVVANGDTVQADGSRSISGLLLIGSRLNTTGLLVKNLDLIGGTLSGGAINSNGGLWNWSGGTIGGTWSVMAGSTFNISSSTDMTIGNGTTINNAGTINWSGAGKLFCEGYQNPSTINNQSGGVFNLGADGTPLTTTYGSTFNNAAGAKLIKTAGSGATLLSGWTFNNSGELGSNVGTLNYNTTLTLNQGSSIIGVGKHEVLGGSVNVTGTTTAKGSAFTVSNGDINGVGALAVLATSSGGSWNWTGGSLSNRIANTGTFNISGTAVKSFNRGAMFNNTGNVTWSGGNIYSEGYQNPATFNNNSPGVFTATSAGIFTTTYGSTFNNASGATFNRTGSATTQFNWGFNNNGLARSTAGTLTLNGGGTGSGRFQTGTGAFVKFSGGAHTLSNSRVIGTGKVQVTGGAVTLRGNLTLGDTTSPSTLEVVEGSLAGTAVIVNNVLQSHSIIASGNASPSLLNWTGGTIAGMQTWAASIRTDISDPSIGKTTKTFARGTTINNDGAVTWRNAGAIYCEGYQSPATFNNRRGAVFTFANAGTPFNTTYGSTFNNQAGATVVKNGTGNLTLTSWSFTNAGTLTTNAGIMEFLSTLTLSAGTRFTGIGTARLAGTTNANTPIVSTGPIRLDAGNFNGGPSTTFTGTAFNWTGGTINTQFTLNAGSAMTVTGTATKSLGRGTVINNNGSVTWSGPGAIYCEGYQNPATFNNRTGATFTFATAGTPFTTTYGATFNNQTGARLVKNGTGLLTLTQWGFNSDSEIAATAGTTEFLSTLNLRTGARFSGAGTVRFAGSINASAPFSVAGPVRLDAGSLNGTPLASFSGTGFTWTGGSINGQLTLNAGSVITASGTTAKTIGNGTVFNNKGLFRWLGGSSLSTEGYQNPATFNNTSGATFEVGADGVPFKTTYGSNFNNQAGARFWKSAGVGQSTVSGWTFNNGSWNGTILLLGGIIEAKTGTINFATSFNLRGGTFKGTGQTLWSDGMVTVGAPTAIENTRLTWSGGTLSATTSGTRASAALSTVGTGNFNWTGGALTGNLLLAANSITNISGSAQKTMNNGSILSNGGTITWTGGNIYCEGYQNPATLRNLAGATFNVRGTGAFNTPYGSSINNAGVFNLGTSVLNSGWSFTQTSTGTTALNINGATLYGQLKTTSGATLAGNLNAVVLATYTPAVGAQFKVITHGSRTGTFGRVTVTGNTTRAYSARYNPSDVSLVASVKLASLRQASKPRQAASATPTPTATPEATATPTPTPTEVPAPTPTQVPSGSFSVSSAWVNVSAASVQLTFAQSLESVSASDLTHYVVTVNGQSVELTGVSVKGNTVILLLPEDVLQGDASVTVEWNGLKDRSLRATKPGTWSNGRNPS